MKVIGKLMIDTLKKSRSTEEIKQDVLDLMSKFPLYENIGY